MKAFELLDQPYTVTEEQIDFYQTNNYIKLKEVLDAEILKAYNQIISARVEELSQGELPIDQRDTYGKAFLQLVNLWTQDEEIKKLVLSKRIGKIAADLMQVQGARLYHDQALFKEGGGGITPWHSDQHYWPLATDKTITAWIPLHEVPLAMGPLEFSAGSQTILEGRELSIGDDSETLISERLRVTDFSHVIEPFDVGEISFHSGWVFHRAGANTTGQMRKVMTIIYMDKEMKLKQPENNGQVLDWETWCPGAKVDQVIDTSLNPVIFPG